MAIQVHYFLVLVAGLLMVPSMPSLVEAGRPDPTLASIEAKNRSSSFPVELVLRNRAQGSVTFQLISHQGSSGEEEVEVHTGQCAAMGPVEVSVEHPVVQVHVMVKANTVKQAVLHINLDGGQMLVQAEGTRSVVVTAMESWRLKSGKYLVIQVGTQRNMALSFKL